MDPWEAMERQQNPVPGERGVVSANGGHVPVQQEQESSKTDGFVRRDQSCRYASSDIPSDLLVKVGGFNYHLHKHPMISRSARLARLVDEASYMHGAEATVVVELTDLPGGHAAFELVAKFCYGVAVDITASNVAVLRCAAEYLEMTEELEDGNLAVRAEAFLSYVVASSWRDSVVVLRSCEDLSPWADDLQLVRRCSESIAAKAFTNPRAARWAYGGSPSSASPARNTRATGASIDNSGQHAMPQADWWVDDICVLRIDHFVRVITAVQAKGMRGDLIGAAITRYAAKWLNMEIPAPSHVLGGGAPWPSQARVVLDMVVASEGETETAAEQRTVVESLISIIPRQKDCVSCSFLLRLLRLAVVLKAAPALVKEVEKLAGMQLDQAALHDILVPSYSYGRSDAAYDVDLVQRLVEQFLMVQEQSPSPSSGGRGKDANTRAQRVASLLDGYLSEVSRDRNLGVSKFQALAESLPESARGCHHGLYRGVDAYLKAHPAMTEHERKRLCRAVDCGKLSRETRVHAARNERLPLRVVVQVLLAEQAKMDAALGRAGKKEEDVAALRLEVQSANARYMELQREVELLQRQLERVLPAPAPAPGKQQGVSGWTSGWKKLGRLGRLQAEHTMATAAPDQEPRSREPRRRRNSAS